MDFYLKSRRKLVMKKYPVICADIKNKVLRMPVSAMKKVKDLTSVEAKLYFEYKKKYPEFGLIIF